MAANATLTLNYLRDFDNYKVANVKITNTGTTTLSGALSLRPHLFILSDGTVISDPAWGFSTSPHYDPFAASSWFLGTDMAPGASLNKLVYFPADGDLYQTTFGVHTIQLKLIQEGVAQIGNTLAFSFTPIASTDDGNAYRAGVRGRNVVRTYTLAGVTASQVELSGSTLDITNLTSPANVNIVSTSALDNQYWVLTGIRQGETQVRQEYGVLNGTNTVVSKFVYTKIGDFKLLNPASGNVTVSVTTYVGTTILVTIPAGFDVSQGLSFSTGNSNIILHDIDCGTDLDPVLCQIYIIENYHLSNQRPRKLMYQGIFQGKQDQVHLNFVRVRSGSRIQFFCQRLAAGSSIVYANISYTILTQSQG